MKPHICHLNTNCVCSMSAFEPNENCEIHGQGVYPPRCYECGRFIPYRSIKIELSQKYFDESELNPKYIP